MRVGHLMALLLLLCSALSGVALAGDPPVPIEGNLYVAGQDESGQNYVYYMHGSSDYTVPSPIGSNILDVSPLEDRVVYEQVLVYDHSARWNIRAQLWTANPDASDPVNVTALAGLGGINCRPLWSPDGKQIAFRHCEPVSGVLPCESGLYVWIMNADGSGAHQVLSASSWALAWAPDGYRLLCQLQGDVGVTVDSDGTDAEFLPSVGETADWSPDGSKIACASFEPEIVGGDPGFWRYLYVMNPDGTDPQVLLQQFVKDSDVEAHLQLYGLDGQDHDWWFSGVRWAVGPAWPQWSPRGDRIAFLAIMPFEPLGPLAAYQVEVWVYRLPSLPDLPDGDLTKITEDMFAENSLSWNGHNTFPEDPEVTVDNTTVTFGEVLSEGLTTIIRDDDPPDLLTGFGFASEYYQISTTAEVTGPISVCFTYRDEDIPSGAEETLCIYHWNEETQAWDDITVSRDTESNTVCGLSDSLSLFGLAITIPEGHFSDVPATGYGESGYFPYWAFWEIEACVSAGIVGGFLDGTYRPAVTVTRDQMAVFVSRALAGGEDLVPTGPATATFPDVPTDHWAYKHVEYAVTQNVVQGYDNGTYRPTVVIDRGQMAVFIARAMVAPTGEAAIPDPPVDPTFPDVPTNHWAYKHIEYCVSQEVVQGYDDGTYRPAGTVTRDQMAVFVQRAFHLPL